MIIFSSKEGTTREVCLLVPLPCGESRGLRKAISWHVVVVVNEVNEGKTGHCSCAEELHCGGFCQLRYCHAKLSKVMIQIMWYHVRHGTTVLAMC